MRLTAKLRGNPEMELTLVDRHDYHQVITELPRVAGGTRAADAVRIPLQDMLATRVRIVQTESSANRDATRFAEPDTFDVDRDSGGHVAFGHGIHYCLGAPLARLEAEIAFGGLLDRFPGMILAVPPADLRWRPSTLIRGLERLPVRLYGAG